MQILWRDMIHKDLRDMIHKDLRDMGVSEDAWYREATSSRIGWCALYWAHFVEEATRDDHHRMTGAEQPTWQVQCPQRKRCFRREGDKKRQKCLAERQKPSLNSVEQCSVQHALNGSTAREVLQYIIADRAHTRCHTLDYYILALPGN